MFRPFLRLLPVLTFGMICLSSGAAYDLTREEFKDGMKLVDEYWPKVARTLDAPDQTIASWATSNAVITSDFHEWYVEQTKKAAITVSVKGGWLVIEEREEESSWEHYRQDCNGVGRGSRFHQYTSVELKVYSMPLETVLGFEVINSDDFITVSQLQPYWNEKTFRTSQTRQDSPKKWDRELSQHDTNCCFKATSRIRSEIRTWCDRHHLWLGSHFLSEFQLEHLVDLLESDPQKAFRIFHVLSRGKPIFGLGLLDHLDRAEAGPLFCWASRQFPDFYETFVENLRRSGHIRAPASETKSDASSEKPPG